MKYIILIVLLFSCKHKVYPHNVLSKQILRMRAGYDFKLTNRTCLKYKNDKCTHESIQEYDLRSESVRETFNKLNFICKIADKRFKICKDKPGFCRKTLVCIKKKWFRCVRYKILYQPAADLTYLIEANTRCYNKYEYSL